MHFSDRPVAAEAAGQPPSGPAARQPANTSSRGRPASRQRVAQRGTPLPPPPAPTTARRPPSPPPPSQQQAHREQPPSGQQRPAAIQQAPASPHLPLETRLPPLEQLLIVVEGINDLRAVRRAVPPSVDVFVAGSTSLLTSGNAALTAELRSTAQRYAGLVVLTDPDVAGRQARQALDEALPGCWHAFVPAPLATAAVATRHHEQGNVGVEHAAPEAIRQALRRLRRSDASRAEFSRQQMLELGLAQPMNVQGGRVTERRTLVGAYLGIGPCDGKQLLRQLNRYGFSRRDLADALAWAERQLAGSSSSGGGGARGDGASRGRSTL